MTTPALLSASEAARRKGVSRQAVYKAIARGTVNGIRVGDAILVLDDDRFAAYAPQPYRRGSNARAPHASQAPPHA